MHYTPHVDLESQSVEHIMRDVNYGWLLRLIHANGAYLFFILVYIHMARGLYYGSYRAPIVQLWTVFIFIIMMATAFQGNNSPKQVINNENLRNLNLQKVYENLYEVKTQLKILEENKHKAGIFLIQNKINLKYYIGSSITNIVNTQFRNHCIHGTGSRQVKRAINKHGLENFVFGIQEYYPGFINKEDQKKNHQNLQKKEEEYIKKQNPAYNIQMSTSSAVGQYNNNKETVLKMIINQSKNRPANFKTRGLQSI